MISPKLTQFIVKYKISKNCEYCLKEFPEGFEFVQIVTHNDQLLEVFGKRTTRMGASGSAMDIHLCPECFNKPHDLLEETEQQGWQVLEDEEEEVQII